jgi:hypothetical protein
MRNLREAGQWVSRKNAKAQIRDAEVAQCETRFFKTGFTGLTGLRMYSSCKSCQSCLIFLSRFAKILLILSNSLKTVKT